MDKLDWQTVAVAGVAGAVILYIIFGPSGRKGHQKRSGSSSDVGLDAKEWRSFKLTSKTSISHDTRRFRFALPSKSMRLGLPVGKHMQVRIAGVPDPDMEDELLARPYTPTSSDNELGYFELVVKIYADGKFTPHLDKLAIGDSIEAQGPHGRISYTKPGVFEIARPMRKEKTRLGIDADAKVGVVDGVDHICMIAGGTGITPMLQVMAQVARDRKDACAITMIFANKSVDDILVREELEALQDEHDNVTIAFTLDKGPDNEDDWNGDGREVGFVTQDLVEKYFPKPAPGVVILECGPPRMMSFLNKFLEPMGYKYITY